MPTALPSVQAAVKSMTTVLTVPTARVMGWPRRALCHQHSLWPSAEPRIPVVKLGRGGNNVRGSPHLLDCAKTEIPWAHAGPRGVGSDPPMPPSAWDNDRYPH